MDGGCLEVEEEEEVCACVCCCLEYRRRMCVCVCVCVFVLVIFAYKLLCITISNTGNSYWYSGIETHIFIMYYIYIYISLWYNARLLSVITILVLIPDLIIFLKLTRHQKNNDHQAVGINWFNLKLCWVDHMMSGEVAISVRNGISIFPPAGSSLCVYLYTISPVPDLKLSFMLKYSQKGVAMTQNARNITTTTTNKQPKI